MVVAEELQLWGATFTYKDELVETLCCINTTSCRKPCLWRWQRDLHACLPFLPACADALNPTIRIAAANDTVTLPAPQTTTTWHGNDLAWQAARYDAEARRCCQALAADYKTTVEEARRQSQHPTILPALTHWRPLALPEQATPLAEPSPEPPSDAQANLQPLPKEPLPDYERVNLALAKDGAKVVSAHTEARKPHALLDHDGDTFMMSDCQTNKWVILELSQVGKVGSLDLSQNEPYTNLVDEFEVLGRSTHPRTDFAKDHGSALGAAEYGAALQGAGWKSLGRFHAEKRRGCQAFQLVEPEWVRYVAIRFLSQHTNELICAVSEVGVYGKTATQDLEDQLISSNGDTEEQAAEAVPTKDGTLDTASTEVDAAADAVAKHVASVDGTTETERNMTPQHDAPAPEADAKRPPAPMPKAVPVIGTDAPRMKPPPLASVPPRSAPDGGSARPEAKGEVGKEAPLPSGGSSRPSSMYDRLIQQLKEMKVQQARLQAAHEELLESTAARIDALVQAQAALTEQLKQVQGMLGDVKPARKGSTFAGWWSVANDD